MTVLARTFEAADRSKELTVGGINHQSVELLLGEGVMILSGVVSAVGLEAVEKAYDAQRRHDLPRRIAARVLGTCIGDGSGLYDLVKAKPVQTLLEDIPGHMKGIISVVDEIRQINRQLFDFDQVRNKYGRYVPLNVANIGVSCKDEAFRLHQDSQGCTGLGYAVQPTITKWEIYSWRPTLPLEVDYIFYTNPGDVVILTQREGVRPQIVDEERGFYEFARDGSLIHRGVVLDDTKRNALALFYQDEPNVE